MTKIDQLSAVDTVSEGDQFPLWSAANGDTRRVSATDMAAFLTEGLEIPPITGIVTPEQYGAAGDGVTDDKASVDTASGVAIATGRPVNMYAPSYYDAASAFVSGRFEGPEILETNDGKRARYFAAVKARPSPLGNYSSVLTTFDGDMSGSLFPVEHRITGTATLGQPTSGYLYTPEATPHFTYLFTSSGHNESTTGNSGRTAATAYRTVMANVGQGDCMAYNFSVFVSGAKAGASGATGWLANPAGSALAGEIIAGASGVYLNPLEINLKGETYDVAGVGLVLNMYRNDATAALGAGWDGVRFQSNGTAQVDSAVRIIGPHKIGLNTTEMTVGDAAIVLAATDRIYFDGAQTGAGNLFNTTLNDTYMGVTALGAGLNIVVNGNAALQVASAIGNTTVIQSLASIAPAVASANSFRVFGATSGAVPYAAIGTAGTTSYFGAATDGADNTTLSLRTANAGVEADAVTISSAGVVNIAVTGASLQIAGTRVLNARKTGWAVATGTATRTTFATGSVTLPQLAERVKALIDDLEATAGHGLIGA